MHLLPGELRSAEFIDNVGNYTDNAAVEFTEVNPPKLPGLISAHLSDPRFATAMRHLLEVGQVESLSEALLMENQSGTHSDRTSPLLAAQRSLQVNWPMDRDLRRPNLTLPEAVLRQNMAIIGDGPAGILMAALRRELGFAPEATMMFSPTNKLGGIWSHDRVVQEGNNFHESFRALRIFDSPPLSTDESRPGEEVQRVLKYLSGEDQGAVQGFNVEKGKVKKVEYNPETGLYEVSWPGGTAEFHSVLVATGNGVPKKLDGGPMETNAEGLPGLTKRMKRWQEIISPNKWPEYDNTEPLIIGLGNSALAMLRQFVEMHRAGINVKPKVITHFSSNALKHPRNPIINADGTIDLPAARHRTNLTKLSLDIQAHREVHDYAIREGWILPSTTGWFVDPEALQDEKMVNVTIKTAEQGDITIRNVQPYVFALIGYQNRPELMRDFGISADPVTGVVDYDPATCRTKSASESSGRLYIAGAAAEHPDDKNRATIPGMARYMGEIAFSEVVAAYAHHLSART